MMLQQAPPVIVDVIQQPVPARDISIDVVITAFASAGVALLVAAIGGLIAGAVFVGIRRFRDTHAAHRDTSNDLRLRI